MSGEQPTEPTGPARPSGAVAPTATLAHIDDLPAGVSLLDLELLLATGRERGVLTQGELVEVVPAVELTAEAIEALVTVVTDEGIELVCDFANLSPEMGHLNDRTSVIGNWPICI